MTASLDRAWQLFGLSRYDLADQELRGVLAGEPNDAMAHAMLGYVLARRGEYDDAHQEIAEAIRLGPDLAYPQFVDSWTLGSEKDYPQARRAILEALRLWPDNTDYLDQLSWVELCLDRPVRALEAADRGLAIDGRHAGCLNCKALALSRLGSQERAVALMQQALEIEPLSSRYHTNLGWIYHAANQPDAALAHFSEGLRLEPDSVSCKNAFTTGVNDAVWSWRMQAAVWVLGGSCVLAVMLAALKIYLGPGWFTWVAGFVGLLISTTFVLQLKKAGRLLLSDEMWAECRWLNAGLAAAVALGYAALWFGSSGFGAVPPLVAFASAATVALYFECRPGWPRNVYIVTVGLLLGLMAYAELLDAKANPAGRSAFSLVFWFVILAFFGVKAARQADPYAGIRGLVVREGLLRRQAIMPVADTSGSPPA